MPGPYRRLDVPNVNQHVVTAPVEKVSKKAAKQAAKPAPQPEATVAAKADDESKATKADDKK